MALSALTPEQQRAVADLVAKGRIAAVPADLAKARVFMRQARDVIADLPNLTKPPMPTPTASSPRHPGSGRRSVR